MTTVEIFVSLGGLVLGYLIVSKLLINQKKIFIQLEIVYII